MYTAAYGAFIQARRAAETLRLTGSLRWLSPLAGRLVYRFSGCAGQAVTIQGHQMVLAAERRYPPLEMLMGRWELDTVRLFNQMIRPGDTAIDAGAHVGYFTLIAARQVGSGGKVVAFEPDAENYELLVHNLALNGYRNVATIRKALAERSGWSPLYFNGQDSGRPSLQPPSPRGRWQSQLVETTSLDAYLEAAGWPRVDFIKMDIEGGESAALRGMRRLVARQSTVRLVVEFSPQALGRVGVSPTGFLTELESLGFRMFMYGQQMVPLTPERVGPLVAHLTARGAYKNLFCVKGADDRLVG